MSRGLQAMTALVKRGPRRPTLRLTVAAARCDLLLRTVLGQVDGRAVIRRSIEKESLT